MTMGKVIPPQRLKQLRELRRLSQDQLAKKAGLTKQTIYRLERKGERRPIRDTNLDKLARALDFDVEVVIGELLIPSEASQANPVRDETTYRLNLRVDPPVRNAYELVARQYGVPPSKIGQLAPLLFVIVAEASLKYRRKKLNDLEASLDRAAEREKDFPHWPLSFFEMDDQKKAIQTEEASIDSHDLFGKKRFDPFGETQVYDEGEFNPFVAYLKALTASSDEISISDLGPTSTEYRVCSSVAIELAERNEEVAGWLLNGEVPIHRMPRDLKTVAERIKWMEQNKITVSKVPEEPADDPDAVISQESIEAIEL
jgi:transcriptional regulator with XRE-family HTH domain